MAPYVRTRHVMFCSVTCLIATGVLLAWNLNDELWVDVWVFNETANSTAETTTTTTTPTTIPREPGWWLVEPAEQALRNSCAPYLVPGVGSASAQPNLTVALLVFGLPRHVVETDRAFAAVCTGWVRHWRVVSFMHVWDTSPNATYTTGFTHRGYVQGHIPPNASATTRRRYRPHAEVVVAPPSPWAFYNETFVGAFAERMYRVFGHGIPDEHIANFLSQLRAIEFVVDAFTRDPRIPPLFDWIILTRHDAIVNDMVDLASVDRTHFYVGGPAAPHAHFRDFAQTFTPHFLPGVAHLYTNYTDNMVRWLNSTQDHARPGVTNIAPEAMRKAGFLQHFKTSDIYRFTNAFNDFPYRGEHLAPPDPRAPLLPPRVVLHD